MPFSPYIALLFFLIITPYCFIGLGRGVVLGSPWLDMANIFIPPVSFAFAMLSKGIIPLWNPYIFSGTPFLVDFQTVFLYPFHLINLFLPAWLSANIVTIAHQLMAGLFMYLYLKMITQDKFSSMVGGAVFALSSAFVTRIYAGHITVICVTAWMPLLFFLAHKSAQEKKIIWIILSAFFLAVQVFAGHIQFVFISAIGFSAYAVYLSLLNKTIYPLKALFISGVLGIGLSAIQIIPLLALAKGSLRDSSTLFKQMFSLPFENLITAFCPGFFGWAKNSSWWGKWLPWEVSLYIGILPLLLAFYAVFRKASYARFFALLFLLSLVFSIGSYLPAHLDKYLPFLNIFRANARFLALSAFALSALCALGLAGLKQGQGDRQAGKALTYTIIFALILVFTLIALKAIIVYFPNAWAKIFYFLISYDKIASLTSFRNNAFAFLFGFNGVLSSLSDSTILLALAILLLLAYLKNLLGKGLRKALIICFIAIDLWGYGAWNLATFDVSQCYLEKNTASFLRANLGEGRFASSNMIRPNAGLMEPLASVGGYGCFVQKRYNEFINFTQGVAVDAPFVATSTLKPSALLGLLNLKYTMFLKNEKIDQPGMKQVFTSGNLSVYENGFFLPKAFICRKAQFISGRDNIFGFLSENSADLRNVIAIEEPVNPLLKAGASSLQRELPPKVIQYQPNQVIVKARLESPGYLVLCDTYDAGWKAFVNGKKAKVIPADYILRAVFLPAGEHTVKFIYRPAELLFGGLISVTFLIAMLAFSFKRFFRPAQRLPDEKN